MVFLATAYDSWSLNFVTAFSPDFSKRQNGRNENNDLSTCYDIETSFNYGSGASSPVVLMVLT